MANSGKEVKVRVVVRVRPRLNDNESLWVRVIDNNTLQTLNDRNTDEALQYE